MREPTLQSQTVSAAHLRLDEIRRELKVICAGFGGFGDGNFALGQAVEQLDIASQWLDDAMVDAGFLDDEGA